MLIAIISDTHLPRGGRRLSERCERHLGEADLILHGGDIRTVAVLDELRRIGPALEAVHGNVDEPALRELLPERLELEAGGVRIAMTHDAGPARGRLGRLRALFPEADLAIFGHSHMPLHERGEEGFQIFNPGSPTERRRAPRHTIGLARVDAGELTLEHVAV